MPHPPSYNQTTDFSTDESNNVSGRSSVRTTNLDTEFVNIEATLDQVITNLALAQASDGTPKDDWVDLPSLAPDVITWMTTKGQGWYATDTGITNAMVVTLDPAPTALTNGMFVVADIAQTNTSQTVTLNVNSLGDKGVVTDGAGTLPNIGSLTIGTFYGFTYDSSVDKFQVVFSGDSLTHANNAENSATAAANSATDANSAKLAAEAALDAFTDQYLGAFANSALPTVDLDGDPLTDGDLAYDTTNNVLMVWDVGTTAWHRVRPTASDQTAINAVNSIATHVQNVSGVASGVSTLSGISADVSTCATNNANITTTAQNIVGVNSFGERYRVSSSQPTVDNNAGDLHFNTTTNELRAYGTMWQATAPSNENQNNINIVAGDVVYSEDLGSIADALTTSSGNGDISTVASSISNVNSLVTHISNVNTAGNNISSINNVAGISSAVSNLSGISSDVTNASSVSSEISTVSGIASDVSSVAGKSTEVGLLGTSSNITAMGNLGTATNVSNMATCSTDINNINTVAGVASGVNFFTDRYRVGTADPTADNDAGDLFFNTTTNELRSFGTTWQATAPSNADQLSINACAGNILFKEDLGSIADAVSSETGSGDITTVANNIDSVNRLGTADAIADMNLLGSQAVVDDMDLLATSANVTAMGHIGNASTVTAIGNLGTTQAVSDLNACSSNASDISTVAGVASGINFFTDRYRIGTSDPTTDNDAGDLFFNTATGELRAYSTSWQATAPSAANQQHINNVSGAIVYKEDLGSIADALSTSSSSGDIATVATNIDEVARLGTTQAVADLQTLGTTANVAHLQAVSGSISNVQTVSGGIADINRYAEEYTISASAPNNPSAGDLWYDSSGNVLKYRTNTTWASLTAGIAEIVQDVSPQLGGSLDCQDNNISNCGTVDGSNLQIDFGGI